MSIKTQRWTEKMGRYPLQASFRSCHHVQNDALCLVRSKINNSYPVSIEPMPYAIHLHYACLITLKIRLFMKGKMNSLWYRKSTIEVKSITCMNVLFSVAWLAGKQESSARVNIWYVRFGFYLSGNNGNNIMREGMKKAGYRCFKVKTYLT